MNKEANLTLPAINQNKKNIFEASNRSFQDTVSLEPIKFNTKYGSIKSALDSLEPIHEFEEKQDEYDKVKNEDLFRNRRLNTIETDRVDNSLDEINKFNSSIMRNTLWGSDLSKKSKSREHLLEPHKPKLKQLEAEIGKNFFF